MSDAVASIVDLFGSLINAAGSLHVNAMNRKSARHAQNRQFNFVREQTQKMIDLANSAHQREVADLRAAGLNPILSAGGSGSSTPSLQGVNIDPVRIENPLSAIGNSASRIARYVSEDYKTQNELRVAQKENTDVDKELKRVQTEVTNSENDLTRLQLQQAQDQYNFDFLKHSSQSSSLATDFLMNKINEIAAKNVLGIGLKDNTDLNSGLKVTDPKAFRDSLSLAEEGVTSAMKMKANENARAWVTDVNDSVRTLIDGAEAFSRVKNLKNSVRPARRGAPRP